MQDDVIHPISDSDNISFNCPKCGKKLKVSASANMRKGKCSGCGAPLKLPAVAGTKAESKDVRSTAFAHIGPPAISATDSASSSASTTGSTGWIWALVGAAATIVVGLFVWFATMFFNSNAQPSAANTQYVAVRSTQAPTAPTTGSHSTTTATPAESATPSPDTEARTHTRQRPTPLRKHRCLPIPKIRCRSRRRLILQRLRKRQLRPSRR